MVTSFPFANGLVEASFMIFRGSTKTLIQFVPLIFIIRLIVIKVSFGGARDYGQLLKEFLFLYVGFFIFQEVMEMVMRAPELADHLLKNPGSMHIAQKKRGWIEWLTDLWAIDIVNMISSLIYWIVCFCYLILMAFMITIGAYIILFSTALRMQWMMKAYFSLVLILSLWPFVWYSVDRSFLFVVNGLQEASHNNGVLVAKLMSGLMKVSVPIVGILAAMKAPVMAASRLGSSVAMGATPLVASKKLAGKAVGRSKFFASATGEKLGVDRALESVRSDPYQKFAKHSEKRLRSKRNERVSANDAAPYLAYQASRAKTKIMSVSSKNPKIHTESFTDFRSRIDRQLESRKSIEEIHERGNKFSKENYTTKTTRSQVTSLYGKRVSGPSTVKKRVKTQSSHQGPSKNSTNVEISRRRDQSSEKRKVSREEKLKALTEEGNR